MVYQQAVEPARQVKTIAKSLEAAVTLEVPAAQLADLASVREEAEEFFIVSELRLAEGAEAKATLVRSTHAGCARCWRYLPSVGTISAHADLCDRCAEAVEACVCA